MSTIEELEARIAALETELAKRATADVLDRVLTAIKSSEFRVNSQLLKNTSELSAQKQTLDAVLVALDATSEAVAKVHENVKELSGRVELIVAIVEPKRIEGEES